MFSVKRLALVVAAILAMGGPALAQSGGGFTPGQALSAAALNQAFQTKQDLGGAVSASTATASGASSSRSLSDHFADHLSAADFGVTVAATATSNAANLNAAIAALSVAGGGAIDIGGLGCTNINATIIIKSNVYLGTLPGAKLCWTGTLASAAIKTDAAAVPVNFALSVTIDKTGMTGDVVRIHSAFAPTVNVRGLGDAPAATLLHISADSSAGTGTDGTRNVVLGKFTAHDEGAIGTFVKAEGVASGLGGNPQVVTLNTFSDLQAVDVRITGLDLVNWTDTNTFIGNSRVLLNANAAVGVLFNSGTPTVDVGVYNNVIQHWATDCFGTMTTRIGAKINAGKQNVIERFYQYPVCESGALVIANAPSSYLVNYQVGANNLIKTYQNGWDQAATNLDITGLLRWGTTNTTAGIVGNTTQVQDKLGDLSGFATHRSSYYQMNSGTVISDTADGAAQVVDSAGTATATFKMRAPITTVGSLPTCNSASEGLQYGVTDATATTFHSAPSGGGANHVKAYCAGSDGWRIGG